MKSDVSERPHSLNLTARSILWRAVFFSALALILLGGCARQIRRPAPGVPVAKVPIIRVALAENLTSGTLIFQTRFRLKSEEAVYLLDKSSGEFSVKYSKGTLSFRSESRLFVFRNFREVEFVPVAKGRFTWQGKSYPGRLRFVAENGRVLVINSLPLTEYLKGVVPHEMPSHTPEYREALLAQTVAARTYALYHIAHPAGSLFDVYSDVRDQVYSGMEQRAELADRAVEKTHGLVLENAEGKLVETQYHSTCGGMLEIRPDYFASPGGEFVKDYSRQSYNCVGSPLYRWVETVTARSVLRNMKAQGLLSAGEVRQLLEEGFSLNVWVKSRKPSGRIDQLRISVNGKDFTLNSWQIRQIFSPDGKHTLPSSLFFMKNSLQDSSRFYLIGAGYGHGKGMCQWGAIGLALKGKTYPEILKFYYPALILKKVY